MGKSSDTKPDIGMSSKVDKYSNRFDMDIDGEEDDEYLEPPIMHEPGVEFLKVFCRQAATSFFNEYGLISHQINSYNNFIKNGIQKLFDSYGEIPIEPGYDPSKKGDGEWRYASVKFGKVTLDQPTFWTGEDFADKSKEYVKMYPWIARLQKMTYSARMKVNVTFQVYTQKLVSSDKFKTGKEQYLHKEVLSEDNRDVIIGRIPVMVKSILCWMSEEEKSDCDFDHGGYFLINGAEVSLKLFLFSVCIIFWYNLCLSICVWHAHISQKMELLDGLNF